VASAPRESSQECYDPRGPDDGAGPNATRDSLQCLVAADSAAACPVRALLGAPGGARHVAVTGVATGNDAAPTTNGIAIAHSLTESRAAVAQRGCAVIDVAAAIVAVRAASGAARAGPPAGDLTTVGASHVAVRHRMAVEEAIIATGRAAIVDALTHRTAVVAALKKARGASARAVRAEARVVVAAPHRTESDDQPHETQRTRMHGRDYSALMSARRCDPMDRTCRTRRARSIQRAQPTCGAKPKARREQWSNESPCPMRATKTMQQD